MTLVKLASFFVLTTFSISKSQVQGEMFVPQSEDKEQTLKTTDKRLENFRVPVENPFDPNFWPARGRRSGGDKERNLQNENCVSSDENFVFDKGGVLCQEMPNASEEGGSKQIRNPEAVPLSNEIVDKTSLYCYGLLGQIHPSEIPDSCRKRLRFRLPYFLEKNFWYRMGRGLSGKRHNQQKHLVVPEIMLMYGDGVYWDLDNSYAEKEKKQDVFWVARGKRV